MDHHATVYRQHDVLTIADVEQALAQGFSRAHIMAGGMYCSHGSKMTYVICKTKQNHFRHLVSRTPPNEETHTTDGGHGQSAQCPCSSVHADAQALLRDHDYVRQPVHFTEWRHCKRPECCKTVFTADTPLVVLLEVRQQNGRFVSDAVLYDVAGTGLLYRATVEVYATHRADRERRQGAGFFEVRAQHILEAFRSASPGQPIVLRCEGACSGEYDVCQPCHERERLERERIEAARLQRERQAEERRQAAERRAEEDRQYMAVNGERLQREAEERQRRAVEEAEERKRRKAEEAMEAKRRAIEERLVWDAKYDDRALWRAEKDRIAEAQRAKAEAERAEAERLWLEELARMEAERQERIAVLDAERAVREAERARVAERMQVVPLPTFRVVMSTAAPQLSKEEIERRRAERMAKQAEKMARKRKRK